jgi:hypothetical protein
LFAPSFEHVKVAEGLGMHPFSVQTSPWVGQLPATERGTQAPATQTFVGPPQSFVTVQAELTTVHTPRVVSQLKPPPQSFGVEQAVTQLPATHRSPDTHWVASKHWFAGAVQTPPPPSVPAMQSEPGAQSAFSSQPFAGPAQPPSAAQVKP